MIYRELNASEYDLLKVFLYDMHGKMNLPSCGKEFFLQPVSRFFFVR